MSNPQTSSNAQQLVRIILGALSNMETSGVLTNDLQLVAQKLLIFFGNSWMNSSLPQFSTFSSFSFKSPQSSVPKTLKFLLPPRFNFFSSLKLPMSIGSDSRLQFCRLNSVRELKPCNEDGRVRAVHVWFGLGNAHETSLHGSDAELPDLC